MVFSSVEFLVFFLPALIVCYFCTPKKFTKCRNLILLLFSLGFYSYGGVKFLGLLFVSIAINYVAALWVNPERSIKVRKTAVALAAVGNLTLLFYFKYTGFFAEVLNGMGCHLPVPEIILPIGISFYTFQGLSYVVDVYREQAAVQKNPLWVALYIAFFPQLVAGPIVRYVTVAEEIEERYESVDEFYQGLVRFLFGFSKKMLLANSMGEVADAIFALPAGNMATSLAWVGAVAYTFQIYFDFSAYSDMAIGLGRMFGFHFEENFKYPYISRSITEFWRRWHISLSTWFRDYVYIPLGGNRKGSGRHIRNIIVVWFLTGMWHGASWNFILWGLWFCILLLGEKYFWGKWMEKLPSLCRHIYTMLLVIISWVLFRCETLPQVVNYISVLFAAKGTGFSDQQTIYYLLQYRWEFIFALFASLPLKEIPKRFLQKKPDCAVRKTLVFGGAPVLAMMLFMLSYIRLAAGSFNPFIYFRF